jgi:hypothetical protein
MAKKQQTTTTSFGWNVSTTTGSNIRGAILNVFKFRNGYKLTQRAECDGMRFDNSAAAFAYALDHGFLQVHVTPWCRHCRMEHTFIGRRSAFCDALDISLYTPGLYDPKTGAVDTSVKPPYLPMLSVAHRAGF